MATLRVFRGDQFVAPFELGEGRTRIGRGTENQLVLEDRDKQVSRTHAEIRHERGQYLITDLNSQNGVWIGERQIKAEEALPVNVPVTIGPYRLILLPDEPLPAAGVADVPATAPEPYVEPTQLGELPTLPPPPSRPVQAVPAPPAPASKAPAPAPARTQTGKTPAPAAPGNMRNLMIIGGAIAAVLVAVVAIMFLRKSPAPETTIVSDTSTTSSTTSTVPAEPAAPTPEEVFQDHFGKAQTLIAEGNKTGARDENTAALTALPDDPRGVAQRTAIDLLPETPVAPPAVTPGTGPSGPATTTPAIAETLRVTARAGESNTQRATREKTAKTHLEDGKKAFAEQKWVNAIDLLQAALTTSGRQDYGNVANEAASMLARARKERDTFVAAQRTGTARRLVGEAKALGTSDIPQAVQKLRDALQLDPAADGAAELQNSLQEQARIQGENALGSAKNLDNRNRADQALREYERAVQLLELVPGGHKDLTLARQRLAELKR